MKFKKMIQGYVISRNIKLRGVLEAGITSHSYDDVR